MTHQMSRKKEIIPLTELCPQDDKLQVVLDGTGSVYDDNGWYLVSISWYCLVLGGTWSAKGLYSCIYWKKWRFGRVTPMPDTLTHSQTTEYRATQLVSSIKHKLSHAISYFCANFARNSLFSEKNYTTGENFTLPPVATVVTNFKSDVR